MKRLNNRAFTLIELLAVIIILGILMLVAIPSVTSYVNNSRKQAYVNTAKELISGATNLVNSGKLDLYDPEETYYIDYQCIGSENKVTSPYGPFVKAYVVVTYDENGYDYYWTSVDSTGQGVKEIVKSDKLDSKLISSNLKENDIKTTIGIDGRSKTVLVDMTNDCGKGAPEDVTEIIDGATGNNFVCRKASTLHTATCTGSCTIMGSASGNTIVYGTIGADGTLATGNAFDCDVNLDGNFDAENERFYYLKDNGDNALLIYYKNVTNDDKVAYDLSGENFHGPRTAATYLPTRSSWKNRNLVNQGVRQITNTRGDLSYGGHNYETLDYSSYAGRFLTYDELNQVCGGHADDYGSLSGCIFLFEDTIYEYSTGSTVNGFWLETPVGMINQACGVHGGALLVDCGSLYGAVDQASSYGVKPVIEVPKSKIDY